MEYFNDSVDSYFSIITPEDFNCLLVPSLASATEGVATQTFDAPADPHGTTAESYWDMFEQADLMADPWYNFPIQENYGKHHDYRLVDWRLTHDLQIRWPRPTR